MRDRMLGTTERVSASSTGQQGYFASDDPAISADGRYVAFRSGEDVFVRDRKRDKTRTVSISSTGREGNRDSSDPAISADGRYVAFSSHASNLVPNDSHDTNFVDVFVRDRKLDTTKRVSVSSAGHRANGNSFSPAISADGRYVAFASLASNLVPQDTNGTWDVFVRDRKRHVTRRVSVARTGHQVERGRGGDEPAISADGRYVAFRSGEDVFVRDRKRDRTRRVSVSLSGHRGDGRSDDPAISATGRYVAFASRASNLVAEREDVFVRDQKLDTTRRVSVSSTGQQGNGTSPHGVAISADGRYVAFYSFATNLVAGDTNSTADVFVRGPLP